MGELWQRWWPHTPMAAQLAPIAVRLVLAAVLGGLIASAANTHGAQYRVFGSERA
jgi:hypothetical protein